MRWQLKTSNVLVATALMRLTQETDQTTLGMLEHKIQAPLMTQAYEDGCKTYAEPTPWPAKITRRKQGR